MKKELVKKWAILGFIVFNGVIYIVAEVIGFFNYKSEFNPKWIEVV